MNLFRQVVEAAPKEGFVSLEVQYIDGTKIESAANIIRFRSGVARGNKHDKRLREKTDAVLREIERYRDERSRQITESTLLDEEFAFPCRDQERDG